MAKRFHLAWFTWQGARDWEDAGRGAYGAMEWTKPRSWQAMAKVLEERALFDMVIFADENAIHDTYQNSTDVYIKYGLEGLMHDPLPLMAMMAMHTKNIGFVSTLNTSVYPPYLLARLMSSLDHLTRGRIGWNVVTGAKHRTAENLDLDRDIPHDERYNMAEEYLGLCKELWASWSEDAVLMDKVANAYADMAKVSPVVMQGKTYNTRGPLTLPRSPQGHPVIVQAGGSDRGRDYAAKNAEVIITHQNTVDDMRAFHKDIKDRMVKMGRNPEHCKVLFTIKPFVGASKEDAVAARQAVIDGPAVTVEVGLANWAARIGVDLSTYDVEQPLYDPKFFNPEAGAVKKGESTAIDAQGAAGARGVAGKGYSQGHILQHYRDGKAPPLKDIAIQEAIKETYNLQGDGQSIAREMADMMAEVGGDGFAIRGSMLPKNVITFTDQVMPELMRLGVVRDAYTGKNFRENLLAF